ASFRKGSLGDKKGSLIHVRISRPGRHRRIALARVLFRSACTIFRLTASNRPQLICVLRLVGILPIMMRKTLFATWGILLLFSANHAFAEHFSLSFSKLCEAENVSGAGASTADAPIESGTDPGAQKAQAKPARPAEDVALSERLHDLIANKLQQYVTRPQDRTAVEGFYRGRDFVPLWVNAAGALPSTREAVDFLHGVAADGLNPKDYPTPTFADRDPTQLAADELARAKRSSYRKFH